MGLIYFIWDYLYAMGFIQEWIIILYQVLSVLTMWQCFGVMSLHQLRCMREGGKETNSIIIQRKA